MFKLLLETFFADFIDLFFPQVSQLMEQDHLEFRPQEVITDVLDQEKHVVDILVETRLKGEEGLILIHVENQSQRLPDYNRKMFKYFARLYEKYQQKILPIVVYAHDAAVEEEDSFRIGFSFLDVLEFRFLKVQLRKEPWRKYIQSANPVAAALMSKMNYSKEERVNVKIEFARMLANMRLDLARNTLLTAFFETYLKLNKTEEEEYRQRLPIELKPEEVRYFMEITTSYHEKGREEGIREGREEGIKEGIKEVALTALKEGASLEFVMKITGLSKEELLEMQKKLQQ
ncbi:MAG: Rpn family recombination-promoting nuclease/putative transposase [Syntrophomonadaceae bacterium]|nr:Rpn family recombination-promoting nuclease/putative transposase [Syntrophomonadaceae bacterium]